MRLPLLALPLVLAASPVFAFNLNDAVNAYNSANGNNNAKATAAAAATPQAQGLLQALTTQLNVTPQQAVGGTGALLGLAKNQLVGNDYSQLAKAVPGLDQLAGANAAGGLAQLGGLGNLLGGGGQDAKQSPLGSLLGSVDSRQDVNKTFNALGMNSGMSTQFAQVILGYLGKQGTQPSLLSTLGNVWGL